MELEKQVCSLELSKRLRELGVKQESVFWWTPEYEGGPLKIRQWDSGFVINNGFSAFTVAELLESLPFSIRSGASFLRVKKNIESRYSVEYNESFEQTDIASCWDENLANALGKMLIYLIEQGIVKP